MIVLCASFGSSAPEARRDIEAVEAALRAVLPPEKSSDFCHRIVLHGRAVCTARAPKCESCCVRHVCRFATGD